MNNNIINKIITAMCLVTFATGMNACGSTSLPASPELTDVPEYKNTIIAEASQPQQLLVKFKTTTRMTDFHSKYGTRTIKVLPVINVHVIEAPEGIRAFQLVKYLENDPNVKYAEINHVINLDTDTIVNPVYTIQTNVNYQDMIGKTADIKGVYRSSRSGAMIQTETTKISIVDLDGTAVIKLPNMTEGSKISISGVIKNVNGFNLTNNIGIMPVSIKKAK